MYAERAAQYYMDVVTQRWATMYNPDDLRRCIIKLHANNRRVELFKMSHQVKGNYYESKMCAPSEPGPSRR